MNSNKAEPRDGLVSMAQVTLEIHTNNKHYQIARSRGGVRYVLQAGPLVAVGGVIDAKTFDNSLLILHG